MKWYVYKVNKMYLSKFMKGCDEVELSHQVKDAYISPCPLSERETDFWGLKEAVKITGAKEYVMEEVENDV